MDIGEIQKAIEESASPNGGYRSFEFWKATSIALIEERNKFHDQWFWEAKRTQKLEAKLKLAEEALALVERISKSDSFLGVFQIAQLHGCQYLGGTFQPEVSKALEELRKG